MTTEHPPLAELAERMQKAVCEQFGFIGRRMTPEFYAILNERISNVFAPLYAENERLRMDVARKNALLFEVQQQVGNQCEDVKRHALTPGLRDRIDAEIGATP